jgi:hypothetical protein
MNTTVNIHTSVFPNKGVEVSFEQYLEVSLDCAQCGRTHRTVFFKAAGEAGICTPSGHAFPGKAEALQQNNKDSFFKREFECIFKLEYAYTEINDKKYPNRRSSKIPTWGRVHFSVTCPKCRKVSKQSIQNNVVRPWTCKCKCGYELYTEKTAFPVFKEQQHG